MDFEEVAEGLLREAVGLDEALAAFVRELVTVGESELALITLLEDAPNAVPVEVVDAMDLYFRGSGDYAEREAVNAIDAYRRLVAA